MTDRKLRQAIAAEAARLLQQRKESDYHVARRKAARWFSRQRVSPADMPSYGEIQQAVYALDGLFSSERQHSALNEMRLVGRQLMELLFDYGPQLSGIALTGPVLPGAQIELQLNGGNLSDVTAVLLDAGHRAQLGPPGELFLDARFPCRISLTMRRESDAGAESGQSAPPAVNNVTAGDMSGTDRESVDLAGLDALLAADAAREARLDPDLEETESDDESGYHPDFFPTLHVLLSRLETVRLDPILHPEGDLLYHTLQVYELGLAEHPYDEEFLLACLLHDVGLALDRRRPLEATWQAIGGLVTPRTWFFIEHRAEAVDYLATGRIRGTLKRSEDFEELVLLARCDLKGRTRGAKVGTVEEVLEYVAGLNTAWDDV